MAARILVCDDETALREMLGVLLRRAGYDVVTAENRTEAIEKIELDGDRLDAVVTDLALPDGSGMDVLSAARKRDEALQVLMITAYGGTDYTFQTGIGGAENSLAMMFARKDFRDWYVDLIECFEVEEIARTL